MTTRLILPPGTDRRTPAEKQEAALVAAFRKMDARARVRLLRVARRQSSGRRHEFDNQIP